MIRKRFGNFAIPSLALVGLYAGCQQSSHTTVHSYEYSDHGRAQPVRESELVHEPPQSEYRMTSPGEMASPGEMVPPGRAVTEPRRNP